MTNFGQTLETFNQSKNVYHYGKTEQWQTQHFQVEITIIGIQIFRDRKSLDNVPVIAKPINYVEND